MQLGPASLPPPPSWPPPPESLPTVASLPPPPESLPPPPSGVLVPDGLLELEHPIIPPRSSAAPDVNFVKELISALLLVGSDSPLQVIVFRCSGFLDENRY